MTQSTPNGFSKDNHYMYSEKTGSHLVFFEILVPSKSRSHSSQTCFLSNVHVESRWGNARGIPHGDDEKKRNKISFFSPFYTLGEHQSGLYTAVAPSVASRPLPAAGLRNSRYYYYYYIHAKRAALPFFFCLSWWMVICSLSIYFYTFPCVIRLAVYSHRSRLIMWLADFWSPFGTFILA